MAKAISGVDGQAYVLRRIDGRQVRSWTAQRARRSACRRLANRRALPVLLFRRPSWPSCGATLPSPTPTRFPFPAPPSPPHPCQVIPTAELLGAAEAAVGRWEPVANHPNLVGLRDAFVSSDWDGSPSLFFAHDYHPGRRCLLALARWRCCFPGGAVCAVCTGVAGRRVQVQALTPPSTPLRPPTPL